MKKRLGARQKTSQKKQTETQLVRECQLWLKDHHIFAWRNNSGALYVNGRLIQYGYPGSGDILGILPDGRFLCIECKSATGKQSLKQKHFQEKIEQSNGVYLLIKSVGELEKWHERLNG